MEKDKYKNLNVENFRYKIRQFTSLVEILKYNYKDKI